MVAKIKCEAFLTETKKANAATFAFLNADFVWLFN